MKMLVVISAVLLLPGCKMTPVGQFEPVLQVGHSPSENWDRDVLWCQNKYAQTSFTEGGYAVVMVWCMKRFGYEIDRKASEVKFKTLEAENVAKD
ncbi:MAG: hypothetical protein JKY34_09050 [Kordiimonadaceae bacterium]|nr:hypothetical protein [Kordiimonadaceae bacterium]